MLRLTLPIGIAVVQALAAIGAARALQRVFGQRADADPASQLAGSLSAQLLVGLPILGTLLFLAGLISTSRTVVCGITLPAALYAVASWRSARRPTRSGPRARDWFGGLALATSGVFAFLFAQLPPFSLDELAYHLAVPMQWIVEGRVTAYPLNSHSWFPFGLESADLFALSLLGHDGGVASHFVRVLCGVALTRVLVQRLASESSLPLLCAAAIATTPALLVTVGWSWNEVALCGIVVVLFLALEDALRAERPDPTWIGLAVCAGLLTKYTFVPIALLLVGAALRACAPARRGRIARASAIGGAAGSIFFARNALLTGNPFEPLLTQGTGDVGFRWTGDAATTAASYVFDPRILDEALGVSLLLLAALLLARAGSRFARGACATLLLACGASALLTPSARVFLPFLVVPALVGGLALQRFGAWARRGVVLALGLAIPAQLALVAHLLDADDPLSLLLGRVSTPQWLAAHRSVTSDVLWIDAALPPRSRTLVLGIHELFWFRHEVRGAGNNDGALVTAYLSAGSPERLRDRLRSDGITHVAIGRGLVLDRAADFKRHERETLLDAEAKSTLADFLLTQRLVAIREPMLLFELR